MVNEKYGLPCWSLTPAISTTWHHETPHSLTLGLGLLALAPLAIAQGGESRCLTWSPTATPRSTASKSSADSDDPRRFAADDGADDDLFTRFIIVLSLLRQALGLQQTRQTAF